MAYRRIASHEDSLTESQVARLAGAMKREKNSAVRLQIALTIGDLKQVPFAEVLVMLANEVKT
ncbi:MAG: hypothetical protein CMO80_01740 [Verrucomicrobiales bacterium]|nr:hypothetical protein [Verrucomicrobiales bacterium]|tara:strand:+ start:11221 stop:11409 length:189 start_codon:yes stop_codon:yes gene_type:complete